MSSLLFACIAAACLVSEIGAASRNPRPTTTPAPDPCHLSGYRVEELQRQNYWVANVTGQPSACVDDADRGNCTFYFAFCHGLPTNFPATNCRGSAVCQIGHAKNKQHSYSMGMYTDDLRFHPGIDSTVDSFYMDVFGGSNISNCTNLLSTRVRFQCNESAIWTGQNLTDFISVLAIRDSPDFGCHFEVILQYSGACGHAASNHSVSPTPTATRGHMNHTKSMNFTTTHAPHSTMTKHMSMNTSMHSMHPTTSHSAGNHSSTKHPGSTNHHPGTTSHHVHSTSPTKASSSTKTHPPSSPTKPVPSATPHPPHHTTPHPHSPTKPATKPTENPLEHKVAGLTAGVVIFALIAFGLVVALVGVIYFFYMRGGGKYSRMNNINED